MWSLQSRPPPLRSYAPTAPRAYTFKWLSSFLSSFSRHRCPLVAAAGGPSTERVGRRGGQHIQNHDTGHNGSEPGMPDLPQPMDYQQTLVKSFTLGGVGLHSGNYAVVRVRPAFAGEGRYFVRVPEGTNSGRFLIDGGDMSQRPVLAGNELGEATLTQEHCKVEWFRTYLTAQEEEGYVGSFSDWTQLQVLKGELREEVRCSMLDIQEGPGTFMPGVEPDLSDETEEILALDPADESVVAASITSVVDVELPFTQLGAGEHRVENVELLLAALDACGVDNARIEVEGGHEIPVLDNSALGWCLDIQVAGLRPAPINRQSKAVSDGEQPGWDEPLVVQKDIWAPSKAFGVQDEEGWISFFPDPFMRLTAGVDHSLVAPVIGSQWCTWRADDVHFRYSLAPARAYVESVEDLCALREAGFVKAGAENLFLIAAGDRWWDPSIVRMVYDEPARFKLTQLIGNLALMGVAGCQGLPVGHITAFNASPSLQLSFVQLLMATLSQADVTSANDLVEKQKKWLHDKYGNRSSFASVEGSEEEGLQEVL